MFDPNDLHPLPRYGLAVAMFDFWKQNDNEFPQIKTFKQLATLADTSLGLNHYGFLLEKNANGPEVGKFVYRNFGDDRGGLRPGKSSGQNTANGYFLSPHVLTSNNSAMMVKEMAGLRKALKGKLTKNYSLKRSFSPMTTKMNAGTRSMSDPSDDVLSAAFTAVATSTPRKAAALDYGSFTNVGLIPDLPFYVQSTGRYPLFEYLVVLDGILHNLKPEVLTGTFDEKKKQYKRPDIFNGNFRYALRNVDFGSLGLVAAISEWRKQSDQHSEEKVEEVLTYLASFPIYIVGYDSIRQEQFGHHLVTLTEGGVLYAMLNDLWKVEFYDSADGRMDYSNPKWKHLIRNVDRFLRFFTPASFQGFLSLRATYPMSFYLIFHKYFLMQGINESILKSAMALGRSINQAAYFEARARTDADKKTNRDLYTYKTRVLASLESNIRSARTADQLLGQLSTTIGRMASMDIDSAAGPFFEAMLTSGPDRIELKQAQNLIVTFMRLRQEHVSSKEEEQADKNELPVDPHGEVDYSEDE
ncbi:hypothetical protein GGR26_000200 [Lewinella marina]|uniref:Uncharacterized protein n=1 Tax=Neolewinella marina TaxID=438751 RepID=A0A2G0CK51_9BACT|nr:hypothetical protein [Neolewinella marina]NJB84455.1 hypothetical protein [Neolewinella marina]PHL00353.1 hypothetical protein CGL56_04785 [Neolewinella marina]